MKWQIPAKTFLVGEYAAIVGAPAIILTTSPCFELELRHSPETTGIHPQSPAGLWWAKHGHPEYGLVWHDPWQGRGGLGASSAQFLGAYLATCYVSKVLPSSVTMLEAYYQCAWSGMGLRPSGYDVLAQASQQCVYLSRQYDCMQDYTWPFSDIAFLLIHSGHKLATHTHLQRMTLPTDITDLITIVEQAKQAFEYSNSQMLIQAINAYQQQLSALQLTAPHSLVQLEQLRAHPDILAAKGCGAMGADVLLLIMPTNALPTQTNYLASLGWTILASNHQLYISEPAKMVFDRQGGMFNQNDAEIVS